MKSIKHYIKAPVSHQPDRGPFISMAEARDFAKHQYEKWVMPTGEMFDKESKNMKEDLDKYMEKMIKLITS